MNSETLTRRPNYSTVDIRIDRKVASADIGEATRMDAPGYGWCLRCGTSNRNVRMHSTLLCERDRGMAGESVAIACEPCWAESDLEERIKLGRALVRSWAVGHLGAAFSQHVRLDETDPDLVMVRRAIELEHRTSCARHAVAAAERSRVALS